MNTDFNTGDIPAIGVNSAHSESEDQTQPLTWLAAAILAAAGIKGLGILWKKLKHIDINDIQQKVTQIFQEVIKKMSTPPFKMSVVESEELPSGLRESNLIYVYPQEPYLRYARGPRGDTDNSIKETCQEILEKGIRFASLNLNIRFLFHGFEARENKACEDNGGQLIAQMLSKEECKLEYLDLSRSSLRKDELISILTAQHSLKCLYISSDLNWLEEDVTEIITLLTKKESKVLILGLPTWKIYKDLSDNSPPQYYEKSKFKSLFDSYNKSINPDINSDVLLREDSLRLAINRSGGGYGYDR